MVEKNKEIFSHEEVLEFFKVSPSTLWRWVKQGLISQYGIGGKRYYKKDDLIKSLVQIN